MSLQQLLEVVPSNSEDRALVQAIDFARLPRHVAVIMDGNGRWAKLRHKRRVEGHRAGIASVRDVVETSARLGLEVLTLYAFSVENWKRPKTEVSTLMGLLKRYLRRELDTLLRNDIRFHVIGRMHELPRDVQDELQPRHGAHRPQHGPAVQHRAELRRARGDHRRRAPPGGRRAWPTAATPAASTSSLLSSLPLHGRAARSRPADPHQRRDAHQQLPALADRLRRDLGHRRALARLPPHAPAAGGRSTTRSASAATAGSPLLEPRVRLATSAAGSPPPRSRCRCSWPRCSWVRPGWWSALIAAAALPWGCGSSWGCWPRVAWRPSPSRVRWCWPAVFTRSRYGVAVLPAVAAGGAAGGWARCCGRRASSPRA